MSSGEVAVYGATGRLGREVARRLAERGTAVRLGARDQGRLETAARELGLDARAVAVALDDTRGLGTWLSGCRVVVNAGPTGGDDPLVRAALDARAHYVDAAGSQPYIARLFRDYAEIAARRDVAIVPACGFDYALGDCLVRLTAADAGVAREVTVAYAIDGSDVGGNSLQFAATNAGGGEVVYESGQWHSARLEVFTRTVDFPPPFGRQAMARYGAGEIITVPRHTRTDAVTTLITARSLVPHPALVRWLPYLRPLVALVRRTPARSLLRLAAAVRTRAGGESAPPPVPRRFAIAVSIDGRDGSRWQSVVEGGDFHDVTSASLAFAARAMAAPGFPGRGVLPPALAVDPQEFFRALQDLGVTVQRACARRSERPAIDRDRAPLP
jgi:short subunit dehydrogenase-like uncharacterized protein